MSRRNALAALLAISMTVGPLRVQAQPGRKLARIGVLSSSSPETRSHFWDAFKDGMAKLGWAEGRDVTYVYRYAHGDLARFGALAAELVAEKPELIFAGTQGAALAAKRATREIPIVFAYASEPVESGLVESLAQPGGNATGLSSLGIDLSGKHMELLKELQPKLRRVTALVQRSATGKQQLEVVQRAAHLLGVEVTALQIGAVEEVGQVLESIARNRPDGALLYGSILVSRRQVVERMAQLRIPAIYALSEYPQAGGLLSYGAELSDNYRRAAGYVVRILKGARPADLPVEQPRTFELVVNMKAAKALGLKIPQSILVRIDRVIE